jgi:hypothetical protein
VCGICKTLIISLGLFVGFPDDGYVMAKYFGEHDFEATKV